LPSTPRAGALIQPAIFPISWTGTMMLRR